MNVVHPGRAASYDIEMGQNAKEWLGSLIVWIHVVDLF